MRLATWLVAWPLLLVVHPPGASGQQRGAGADKAAPAGPTTPLAPAAQGFDARRDGVERGKVETVEYDSKTVGARRKLVVYTPPGYSKDAKYPVLYLLH